MPKLVELLLIVPIALVASLAFGALLMFLISRLGGWHRLAEKYATYDPPTGKCFWMQSANFGNASYSGCVTICTSERGLYLSLLWPFRFAHSPLLIPWREIHQVRRRRVLWMDRMTVDIGAPKLATVDLPQKVFEGHDASASR